MKKLTFLIRILIAIILLFIVYYQLDKKELIYILKNSNVLYLFLSLLVFVFSNFTGALGWYFLLKSQNLSLNFKTVISASFIGAFFNNFMPTNIGGDVVKAFKIIKNSKSKEIVISSIVWDRITGLIILLFFTIISGFIFFKKSIFLVFLLGMIFFIAVMTVLVKRYGFGKFLLKIVDKIPSGTIKSFLYPFLKSFKRYLYVSKSLILFYIISIITQYLKIFIQVLISIAFNVKLEISAIYFLFTIIGIISVLPISINGIGLREFLGKNLSFIINSSEGVITFFVSVGNIIIMIGNLFGVVFFIKSEKMEVKK